MLFERDLAFHVPPDLFFFRARQAMVEDRYRLDSFFFKCNNSEKGLAL